MISSRAFAGPGRYDPAHDSELRYAGAAPPVGDWRCLHDATTQRVWVRFTAGVSETLVQTGAATSSQAGLRLSYDAARASLDLWVATGAAFAANLGGATSECLPGPHTALFEKSATGFVLWLDGARLLDGAWATPPSAEAAAQPVALGAGVAEFGVTAGGSTSSVLRYLGAVTRAPDRSLQWVDGVGTAPLVHTHFRQASATPGAAQVVARVRTSTTLTARARSNGELAVDVPVDGSRKEYQPAWFEPRTGEVAIGKVRRLLLFIGESGMAGFGISTPLPIGYPPQDRSCWVFDREGQWGSPLYEPLNPNFPWPLDDYTPDGNPADAITQPGVVGTGPAGMTAWRVQQALGSGYEVGAVFAPRGGSTSAQWNANKDTLGSYLGYALYKTRLALATPRTELMAVALDQGINDTHDGPSVWKNNWTSVMAYVRNAFGPVPLVYTRLGRGIVPNDRPRPGWYAVDDDQVAFQGAINRVVLRLQDEPGVDRANGTPYVVNGMIGDVHYGPRGNALLADRLAAALTE